MAKQKEIRVGSIVKIFLDAGIVLAFPSRFKGLQSRNGSESGLIGPARSTQTADIYWFGKKHVRWEYVEYLKVLVR